MGLTMDMLTVITLPAPKGAIPDGLKPVALSGPDAGPDKTGSPVVAVGSFTFWPMSYTDNRMSFGMVMYDPSWNVVSVNEIKGARYIYKITTDGSGDSGNVTFWGQSDQTVQLPVSAFEPLMLKK